MGWLNNPVLDKEGRGRLWDGGRLEGCLLGRVREGRLAEQASLNLLCPTLDRSAILPCRTAYHNLLRPTLECSYWSVHGRESGSLEGCLLGQASRLTIRP